MDLAQASGTALIGAVLAQRCVDAEPLFAELVSSLQRRGVRLGGVQQINVHREGYCRCDMKLKDLSNGEVVCISEDRGPEARGCRLDWNALAEATERVVRSIRAGVDLVVINKFGKAESEGAGMRDAIEQALEYEVPVLICANAEHHANLLSFTGELAVTLTLSGPDIETWLDAVLAARCTEAAA
jgi:nucleoside-triphosphatase THEP1